MAPGGDQDGDDRVLSPDELDIEEQEDVASLGDGRYVIGADRPPAADDMDQDDNSAGSGSADHQSAPDADQFEQARTDQHAPASTDSDNGQTGRSDTSFEQPAADTSGQNAADPLTGSEVKDWLSEELASHGSSYAYHIASKSGGSVTHQQLATNDVGAAFDGLLVWYARQLSEGTPVDEALGILLAESTIQVRYPTSRLVAYLEEHNLGPEDSIEELVNIVSEEGGLVFPKRE